MERHLVEAAASGDARAVEALLQALQPRAWGIACGFTRDWDEAEDLAQQILLEVYRRLPELGMQAASTPGVERWDSGCAWPGSGA
ncbi:MAG: sigma factor [Candidatus Latescibacterota bacterium]